MLKLKKPKLEHIRTHLKDLNDVNFAGGVLGGSRGNPPEKL